MPGSTGGVSSPFLAAGRRRGEALVLQDDESAIDQAPETGYQESGRLSYSASDPDWDDRDDRNLVVKFADGMYGFVTVSMRMDGDFYVAVNGVWNPTGSTWLD